MTVTKIKLGSLQSRMVLSYTGKEQFIILTSEQENQLKEFLFTNDTIGKFHCGIFRDELDLGSGIEITFKNQ